MSFGFSVGDFLAAIELANRIRSRFVDAPDQFRAISNEVKSLSNVLRDIDDVLPQRDLPDQQKTEFGEIIKGCQGVFKELEETLDKYQKLDSNTKGFAGRSRRVWKRFRWDQNDIDGLRSRVTSNILMFNTFLERISSRTIFATKDGMDQLVSCQHDQDRQAILNWLTSVDYATQQSDFISRRQGETGLWLVNSNQFRFWVDQSNQTLFCPGIPGAGKTMSAAIVVDELYTKFQNDVSIGIAYIYCNFRRQYEQRPIDLLASLLKQLIQGLPSVPQSMQQLYEHHKHKRTRPSFDDISRSLQSVVPLYSKTFIVVDALDECQVSDGGRKRFFTELFNLQAKTAANLFVTSRFLPDIEKEFEGRSARLEIRANDDDLRRYLDAHMLKLPSFVSPNLDLQEEIKSAIIKAVDGMYVYSMRSEQAMADTVRFLLAQLHLDSLIGKRSRKAIRSAMEKLPKGSEAYDQAYREAMERIEGQVPGAEGLGKQVLSWITCAKRPLTTLELQHALAVEAGESELDEENLPEIDDMISVCAGLVTVDEESNIIRLVHYTTQEYFERTQSLWFLNAQKDIAAICVTYLSFDVFDAGFCSTDEEFEARLRLNPLYDYTARNWGHHTFAAFAEVEVLTIDFLESETKLSASSQAMIAAKRYSSHSKYSQEVPKQVTGVHLAAYFGLENVMGVMIKNGYSPDHKDSNGRTPLSWAAERGHEAVARLLLTRGVDPDSKSNKCRTPLSYAAENGQEAMVKLLVERDDVEADSRDGEGRTPLSRAAESGHKAVVKVLLTTDGVNPNSRNNSLKRTPLAYAAINGHEAVVKLLLAKDGVNLYPQDSPWGLTPLLWAAQRGHEMVVKLMLAKYRADLDSKNKDENRDNWGRTALSLAAKEGREAMVKLLLATDGIDRDSKDDDGRTPLSHAAENGQEAVVLLLLTTDGVEPDSKDRYGRTPLWWAIEPDYWIRSGYANVEVVKLLLAREGVDPNSKGIGGLTPLLLAARLGHEEVVNMLLTKNGVDPDSKDDNGRTALSFAAQDRHEAVVKLLLAKDGVDPDARDNDGRTPLSWATDNWRPLWEAEMGCEVVKLLLAKNGVDPHSKDNKFGRTPLSWAAGNGYEKVVELLLATDGTDQDSKDTGLGRTPLSWAAISGHRVVVKLLLTRDGVDPDSKDHGGQTPLSCAAGNGEEAVVMLLVERNDVDPNSRDNNGQTPLSWAATTKREEWMEKSNFAAVIELLLANNRVDVNSKDTSGRTPLSWAAGEGHVERVKPLLAKDGINRDIKDSDGHTGLWWAEKNSHEEVVKILSQQSRC